MHDLLPCPGCRTGIEPGALFCVQCGLCVLSITGERTVLMPPPDRWPPNTPPPGRTEPQRVVPPARTGHTRCVTALDDEIEIGLDDVELEEDEPFVFRPPPLPERVVRRKVSAPRRTALPPVPPTQWTRKHRAGVVG